MILAVTGFVLAAVLAVAACALWRPRWLGAVFPALFLSGLAVAQYSVHFVGYAVDARFLAGTEATVLNEIESPDAIYLLVRFAADNEPRLVRLPNTDQNRKDAEKAKQAAQQGLAVIRFGADPGRGPAGEDQGSADSIHLLDPGQSHDFGKPPQ